MLSRRAGLGAALLAPLVLAGCASPPALDAGLAAAPLTPERFFAGTTYAEGEFVNVLDGTRRGVRATIRGRFDGRVLTLVEDFAYSDGETDRKTWMLTKTGPATYSGVREDVIGTAQGRLDGPFFRLSYVARVRTKTSAYDLAFEDVLGLQPDGAVLNRAVVSKFGVKVGEVTLRISRRPATASLQPRAPRR